MFSRNVGNADRVVRILMGIAIIVIGIVIHSWWGLLGLLPIATGVIRFCGLYPLLGINTCAKSSEPAAR
jgi:predicted RND superfamily exporter protein